jgi:predicted HTH transcriptional regulator
VFFSNESLNFNQIDHAKSETLWTTFERQQRLIEFIRQQPGIRVPGLARLLGVSEGTTRNDLRPLPQAGQLKRVRGGLSPTGMALPCTVRYSRPGRTSPKRPNGV